MHIIYASCLCEKEYFYKLFKTKNLPGQQVQKYHRLLTEGFAKNGIDVSTVSAVPMTSSNTSTKFLKAKKTVSKGISYNHLPVINIPVLKNAFITLSAFFKTLFLSKKGESLVICDILNISVSIGARLAAKVAGVPAVGIVTDVPSFLSSDSKKLSVKINNRLMNSFDSYVFLTDAMKDVVNCKNKKYVVIEGLVDSEMQAVQNTIENKSAQKVCIYAGGIQKIYGIKYLTEAFIMSDIENCEFHIYGDGDFKDELIQICKTHKNIKYFGIKPNDYIVTQQLKATLLINPRPTNQEFVKYSFPSKNMEYMVSGTPILTTRLPGMPKEYYPYIYTIDNEDKYALAETLKKILLKSPEELHAFGKAAKEWVLKEKNNIVQAKKIIDMINNSEKKS